MRIAIDCRAILNPGAGEGAGIGHYVYFLVQAMLRADQENQYVLFFDRGLSSEAAKAYVGAAPNAETIFLPFSQYKKYLPFAYSHLLVANAIRKAAPDLFHLPAGTLPLGFRIPTVVTVADLVIYEHPEWFPKQNFSVKVTFPRTVKNATHRIAVSEATKQDLAARFGVSPNDVTVVYPGVDVRGSSLFTEDLLPEDDAADSIDFRRRYGIEKPYLLFLGTIEPRKNVEMLVRAFVRAWKESGIVRQHELLIAGAPGWGEKNALAAAREAEKETNGAVRLLGYIGHRDKFPLMKNARAFVFPSLAEGFGMPVAEAMALGVPTIVSSIPVFHEIAGNAVLYADPNRVEDFARAITRVLEDGTLHARLSEIGPIQAKRYTWESAARETIRIYKKVMDTR